MEREVQQGYRMPVSKWRWVFVRQVGLRWTCECSDMQAFGGKGYECRHVLAVKRWLQERYRKEVA